MGKKNKKAAEEEQARWEEEAQAGEAQAAAEQAEGQEDEATLRKQRDEYLALWQRAQADYKNLKRRSAAEVDGAVRRTMAPLLENLLLVLDYLDMALKSPAEVQETKDLAMGVSLTRDQLLRALDQEEVVAISTSGAFDPELHQAVERVEDSGMEPGSIVRTKRSGYSWRGIVLRPAQVDVAAQVELASPEQSDTESPAEDQAEASASTAEDN